MLKTVKRAPAIIIKTVAGPMMVDTIKAAKISKMNYATFIKYFVLECK